LLAAIRAGIAATDRGDYKQGYHALAAAYGNGASQLPPDGLSHYGLCIAIVEKQTRKGAELCRLAISAQFYDSAHYANLIRLYLARGDRRQAVDTLHEALARLPEDWRLLRLRREMGYREKPVIPFLERNNPLNKTLGIARANAKKTQNKKPKP
jgi:tetratricopeptide (TPR) repeat protein